MRAVIFAGPSLPPSVAAGFAGIEWRPPVRQGDIYLAALSSPAIIGIIDGYFEIVPTVWHKEILWAMDQGIHVYGGASIGALRAAELADFGMTGIGQVYEQYRAGRLTDDDEVAVLHGPEEVGYVQVTIPASLALWFESRNPISTRIGRTRRSSEPPPRMGLRRRRLHVLRPGSRKDRSIKSASMRSPCFRPSPRILIAA